MSTRQLVWAEMLRRGGQRLLDSAVQLGILAFHRAVLVYLKLASQ
jgi:hypothetical protein